eukprot:9487122-Pyramimonas_sp.AAC.1
MPARARHRARARQPDAHELLAQVKPRSRVALQGGAPEGARRRRLASVDRAAQRRLRTVDELLGAVDQRQQRCRRKRADGQRSDAA